VDGKQQDNKKLPKRIKTEGIKDFVLDSSSTSRDPCLRAKLEDVQTRF
jgi:hypothetical protein